MKRSSLLLGFASLLAGCGSAQFYEEVPVAQRADQCAAVVAPAPPPVVAEPEERASEIVVADTWNDSLRDIIHLPPERAASNFETCAADLAAVHADVSEAIDLAIAHHDWRRQRCLSTKAQAVGTLYHAVAGYPFRDQEGRAMDLPPFCFAVQIAREAQACAS